MSEQQQEHTPTDESSDASEEPTTPAPMTLEMAHALFKRLGIVPAD